MRTDVKVGLICVFAIILGVVIYFVAQGQDHPRGARAATPSPTATPAATPAASAPARLDIAQPPAGAASTQTAAQILQSMAQTPPPGGVGGGPIQAPSAGGAAGGGNFGPPGETSPPLEGGRPAGILPTSRPAEFGAAGGPARGVGIDDPRPSPVDRMGAGGGRTAAATHPAPVRPADPEPRPAGTASVHTVVKGDMLGTIATKYGVTVKAIEAINPGIDSTHLKIGQPVNIPAASAVVAATHPATRPAATRPGRVAATAPVGGTGTAKPGTNYTVKKGDTLSTIALTAYGDKNAWQRIFRANRGEIADANVVAVGTVLKLPQ